MSARVFNPVVLTEFCRLRSPVTVRRHIPSVAALAKVKKDLFGPASKDDARKFLEKELSAHQEQAAARWGFDFSKGNPIAGHRQYEWERVPPTTGIPEMYTLSRAAHLRELTPNPGNCSLPNRNSIADDLLDERAARQNAPTTASLSSLCADHDHEHDDNDEHSMDSDGDRELFASPATAEETPNARPQRIRRQPKITEYLKLRKRLAPTQKRSTPTKKSRNTSNAVAAAVAAAAGNTTTVATATVTATPSKKSSSSLAVCSLRQ